VAAGGMLYVSGQGPLRPDGSGPDLSSFEAQVRLTLDNLKTVLEECGSSLNGVVKTTVYLTDMDRFAVFNAIYGEYFPSEPPARTCIQAARLPLGFEVEVDAVAVHEAG
jgi:2-iminobutanoate/2-iminopropanoate deaminase